MNLPEFPSKHLIPELEAELARLVDVWFPRSLDREHGGFLCNFDRRWRVSGAQPKMLEFQARQTLAAARLAARFPDRAELREAAIHGFCYLKETMWDQAFGGWFRMLDREANPLEGATKHGHGMAYAISACAACHALTRDPDCLELAQAGFAWLEAHAHDESHGGYFVFYRRDGAPILSRDQAPAPGAARDAIGTPIGYKDANTTSDLLKGLADLYRLWPDSALRKRVEELLAILRDRLVVAPGVLHMFARPEWTPLPDLVRYGQVLRSAYQLVAASRALGEGEHGATVAVATAMVDTMLGIAWDPRNGGFHAAGTSFGPMELEGSLILVPRKCWWVEADGMKVLLMMARLHPAEAGRYANRFEALWRYAKTHLIDRRHGGWYQAGLDVDPQARKQPKATVWKDASHESEALLDCLAMLQDRSP